MDCILLCHLSADPLSNMSVDFDSKEEAIAFAVRSGMFSFCIASGKVRG